MAASDRFGIQGHVSRGFEVVREAFEENFVRRRELGGACSAFHSGEKVVDLWGGIRNKQTCEPWEQDTMVLAAPAVPPLHGFHDECLKGEVQFSLGFMKPSPVWPFGSVSSFGAPGSGGFADPAAGVGYAYVTSQMGTRLSGDPRDVALREALYSAIPSSLGALANY